MVALVSPSEQVLKLPESATKPLILYFPWHGGMGLPLISGRRYQEVIRGVDYIGELLVRTADIATKVSIIKLPKPVGLCRVVRCVKEKRTSRKIL